jgi:hypothetical protein
VIAAEPFAVQATLCAACCAPTCSLLWQLHLHSALSLRPLVFCVQFRVSLVILPLPSSLVGRHQIPLNTLHQPQLIPSPCSRNPQHRRSMTHKTKILNQKPCRFTHAACLSFLSQYKISPVCVTSSVFSLYRAPTRCLAGKNRRSSRDVAQRRRLHGSRLCSRCPPCPLSSTHPLACDFPRNWRRSSVQASQRVCNSFVLQVPTPTPHIFWTTFTRFCPMAA